MSSIYADGLSEYKNRGKLGLAEVFDNEKEVDRKVGILADYVRKAKIIVVHTGAGISTAAGIPDFRGPKGVWTLERKGLKVKAEKDFDEAVPTKTHMALVALQQAGIVSYVVSQNIDGLHLRSGLQREALSEMHGNVLVSRCDACKGLFVRPAPAKTVGKKATGEHCPSTKHDGRKCRGKLFDTLLDWEDCLPREELEMAEAFSGVADLSITLGTSLQLDPSGSLPCTSKKLVICNLQKTKYDDRAAVVIHAYIDVIMTKLCQLLGVTIPEYDRTKDPFLLLRDNRLGPVVEWRVCTERLSEIRSLKNETEPEKKSEGGNRGGGRCGGRGRVGKRRGNGWTVKKKSIKKPMKFTICYADEEVAVGEGKKETLDDEKVEAEDPVSAKKENLRSDTFMEEDGNVAPNVQPVSAPVPTASPR